MAEANTVNVADARTFLADFVADPASLATMPEPDVIGMHSRISAGLTKHAPNVIPFGAKWREAMAGDDADDMATLGRFQDPKALWGRTKELTKKLSSGELKQVVAFPEKGNDHEKAQWRLDNGVPETPDKYDIKLDGNVVVGEDDKPVVDGFLKYAHSKNWNNAQAKEAMQWYFGEYQVQQQAAIREQDQEFMAETQAALSAAWGADYKRNNQAMANILSRMPEKLRERFWNGRLGDGRPIGSDPDMVKFLVDAELQINPHTTLMGPAGANELRNVEQRIAEIETMMKTNRKAYNDNKAISGPDGEYQQLLDARDRVSKRGAPAKV